MDVGVYEVCSAGAIIALGVAFQNFFAGRAKHPSFKKRGQHDSFRLSSGQFRIQGKRLRIPNVGWIRLRETLRWEGARAVSVTISHRAGRWFAAVQCELPDPDSVTGQQATAEPSVIGIDVGVREYVFSDGTRHPVPRHLRQAQQQLRRAQQDLSRKERGSSNRAKARQRVARLHARVADRRADWLHKLTTSIVDRHDTIVIEDLNVRSMTGNRRLALSIADASFGQFRQMLTYKTQTRRRTLLLADRWFPSTRLCSVCGAKTKHRLPLHIRAWTCDTCRTSHDRDLNAARNLAAYDPAVSSTVAACGALLTTDETKPSSDLSSHRHEPGTRHYDELQLV